MLGGTPGALVPGTLVVYPCDRGWVGLNVFGADSARSVVVWEGHVNGGFYFFWPSGE